MKRIKSDFAKRIIVYGEGRGFSLARIVSDDIQPITIYHRIYKNKKYDIAEIETYDYKTGEEETLYYEVDENDYTNDDSELSKEWNEAFNGLKNTLEEIVNLLKEDKEVIDNEQRNATKNN